jgi:hypothetical protein
MSARDCGELRLSRDGVARLTSVEPAVLAELEVGEGMVRLQSLC